LKREGLKTGKREVLNVHRWKVESSVPELLMSEGFMYLYKTSMDNELVLGAGQMHFEICQQEFHQNLAPDWKWDRHYGLV
ncbi:MAG TPA: hypothetical protein PLD54_03290, partial [Candidatus Levybacteria bacterium]|nr:hypothetical protein [Candidatus Levybacteria bacterium]